MKCQLLAVLASTFLAATALAAEPSWISLFDGKTLDGWTVKGGKATYKVENGMIVGTTVEGSPNTFLCRGPYSDFELKLGHSNPQPCLRSRHSPAVEPEANPQSGRGVWLPVRDCPGR